jgi:hypothetical protein
MEKPESTGEWPKYTCKCGYSTTSSREFTVHLLNGGREEKGKHSSLGRLNEDGSVALPPAADRTPEQKAEINKASEERRRKKEAEARKQGLPKPGKAKPEPAPPEEKRVSGPQRVRTGVLAEATSFRLIPKVYEAPLSPIMIGAREAVTNVWGWPADMNFGDFLDTWLYNSFKAFGVTLNTYSVDETVEEESQRIRVQDQASQAQEESSEESEESEEDEQGDLDAN